jgi:hypothetical protein
LDEPPDPAGPNGLEDRGAPAEGRVLSSFVKMLRVFPVLYHETRDEFKMFPPDTEEEDPDVGPAGVYIQKLGYIPRLAPGPGTPHWEGAILRTIVMREMLHYAMKDGATRIVCPFDWQRLENMVQSIPRCRGRPYIYPEQELKAGEDLMRPGREQAGSEICDVALWNDQYETLAPQNVADVLESTTNRTGWISQLRFHGTCGVSGHQAWRGNPDGTVTVVIDQRKQMTHTVNEWLYQASEYRVIVARRQKFLYVAHITTVMDKDIFQVTLSERRLFVDKSEYRAPTFTTIISATPEKWVFGLIHVEPDSYWATNARGGGRFDLEVVKDLYYAVVLRFGQIKTGA